MNDSEDNATLTLAISSLDELAITVPATLLSAISLAKLGPLKTPTLLILISIFSEMISDMDLKGFNSIPFVHEITDA